MTAIPFMKLHGAENDFLLTWAEAAPGNELPQIARRICARTTGIGADGWMLVARENGGLRTRLFNSDGSEPEISGNGTRCAAAFGIVNGAVSPPDILIATAAGRKQLRLISRRENRFLFEMNMGVPKTEELHSTIPLAGRGFDATVLNVGNPQCAIFVDLLPENWRAVAQQCERDPRFPQRTNVSFVRLVDRHTVDAVFYERGAGETRSSGTGSTGAACAAILRGVAESPVEIRTPAGSMVLRWDDGVYLTGPAEIIGEGRFFLDL
ncbi:MAG TPA: diaminopimelate epimerase [Bryobacteraceae bacterium]|jgi:diaminopimelate epimerase|nr:diaminopimelate epimerase [Bryobacteraceae bacterium]